MRRRSGSGRSAGGRADERADDAAVLRRSVKDLLDRDDIGIGGGLFDKPHPLTKHFIEGG